MAFLVWKDGDSEQTFELSEETSIGRSKENALTLVDPRVSSAHARIVRRNGRWLFEDLDSTNGSIVNGQLAKSVPLANQDVIRLGHIELVFNDPPARGPATSTTMVGPRASTRFEDLFRDDPAIAPVSTISAVTVSSELETHDDPETLLRRLRACYEIAGATADTLDLTEILNRVLSALFSIFSTAERAFIFLVDPETKVPSAAAEKRRVGDSTDEMVISRTALARAMEQREAVLCLDAMTDQRLAQAQSIVTLGIKSLMIAPLVFHEDVLGAIYVDARSAAEQFTEADLRLLSAAAAQVAACVANAMLHTRMLESERLAAVGQTVAGLTHCIKNILQGVKGGSFIVEKAFKSGDTEKVQKGWDMVRRNNAFMEDLVFDLLSYSKEREPAYEDMDLNALCGEICELLLPRAQGKGVTLLLEPAEGLGEIEADPKGLKRSVLNLVTNAVDACADCQGTVRVSTRAEDADGFVAVVISDTGCGMPEEVKAKLFTVFFSTKGSKGTGLGLPVTKKIIEEHGGGIYVDSEVGRGTTFTILIPPSRVHEKAGERV